jgi:hypothetical protein
MAKLKGFWSYVHADDQAEGGRITRLAKDVKKQYEMLANEEIDLFLDIEEITWGQVWRELIDSQLSSVAFFIPVITPRFFQSPECRRELLTFAQQAKNIRMNGIILPLKYVDVPELKDEKSEDELIRLIRSFQWEDWTDTRFKEVDSEAYRRGVSKLAEILFDANRRAEQVTPEETIKPEEVVQDEVEDTLGVIDKLAHAEEELRRLPKTLESMTQDIDLIGQIMRDSTKSRLRR